MAGGRLFVFRADRRNVGDWWSPPVRYFDFGNATERDLLDVGSLSGFDAVIVGGGGLAQTSSESMMQALSKLARKDRSYLLVAWGVGADTRTERGKILTEMPGDRDIHKLYDGFDIIGTRIHSEDGYGGDHRFHWVPCASAMHPAFLKLRETKPTAGVGLYAHRRVPIAHRDFAQIARARGQRLFFGRLPRNDNTGRDITAKLEFIARHEYIVTNSYHGVYWATLLRRKVICVPFKNGLFSFRHRPAYHDPEHPEKAFEEARVYPDALDECREANTGYYALVRERLGQS